MLDTTNLLRIQMLGGLRVQRGETTFMRFRTRQTAALLAYLAYFPQQHSRELLIEQLWPDRPLDKGRNNLRVALYSLRHQLELPDAPPGTIFEATRDWIQLHSSLVSADVHLFEAAAQRAAQTPVEAESEAVTKTEEHLFAALSLYKGPLLQGFYEDWIPLEESRLEDLFINATQRLLHLCEARQDAKTLRYWVHHAARVAPHNEQVQQWLEQLKINSGTTRAKSRVAPRKKAAPLPDAAFDFDAAFDAALPATLNRFFGREKEIATVRALLDATQTQLVTLVGPGGCGKTRLALELAHRLTAQDEPLPVVFVPLADITDAALLGDALLAALPSVAPALFTAEHTSDNDWDSVIQKLKQLPACLLILDNFEQLLPVGADFMRQLGKQVPALRYLVTSRQSLSLPKEKTVVIGPLSVPEKDETDLLKLLELPAVRLFVDRAQTLRPDFQLTPHNACALTALVRRLEGIPLALELCAAQSRVLSPGQILVQVEANQNGQTKNENADPLRLSARPDSVHSTFAWIYQLLTPPLQAILRALSTFRGGFSIEAAVAVCNENLVLPALAFLRDSALVQSHEIIVSPGHSEMRFSMLETTRAFAAGLLTDDERLLVEELHAVYYLELAEHIKATPNDSLPGWHGILEREQDNFWAALQWSSENCHQWALALAMALREYWIAYQPARGRKAFATLTAKIKSGTLQIEASGQTALLCAAGELEMRLGNLPEARALIESSLHRAQAARDESAQLQAVSALGLVALEEQSFVEAQRYFDQALALARSHDNQTSLAWLLRHRAAVWRAQGQEEAALECLNEALALFQTLDDENGAAWVQLNIAGLRAMQNEWEAAQQPCDQALDYFRQRFHKTGLMWTLHQRGEIAFHLQQSNARALFTESLALARALDSPTAIALCLQSLENLP